MTGLVVEPLHPRDLVRPRLRGWLHLWAAIVSVVTGVVLWAVAPPGPARAAVAVYGGCVVALFGTSALYHRVTWTARGQALMSRLDHSMIFLLIAGTYTPFAVTLLEPRTRAVILTVVWLGAAAGIAVRVLWPRAPRALVVPLYLGLGWVAVFVLPQILEAAGAPTLVLLIAGGVVYSVGGVVYAARRPDPAPHVFGYHEVFHACTLVAAACHHVAVYLAVFA